MTRELRIIPGMINENARCRSSFPLSVPEIREIGSATHWCFFRSPSFLVQAHRRGGACRFPFVCTEGNASENYQFSSPHYRMTNPRGDCITTRRNRGAENQQKKFGGKKNGRQSQRSGSTWDNIPVNKAVFANVVFQTTFFQNSMLEALTTR